MPERRLNEVHRKDRHTKVCTAKGPRGRRVRLAAHTAIQFYDVQDRLGYGRSSKAVDWLINKARAAINELATRDSGPSAATKFGREDELQQTRNIHHNTSNKSFSDSEPSIPSFSPTCMDSDAIDSFFPSSSTHLHDFNSADLNTNQDLKLYLHSSHDPIVTHNPNQSAAAQLGFNSTVGGWAMDSSGYLFNTPPPLLQQLLGHNHNHYYNQLVSQRGPLQSSNTPSIRAWIDHQQGADAIYTSSFSGGFRIPARIQGGEEEHGGYSGKPSSTSSD